MSQETLSQRLSIVACDALELTGLVACDVKPRQTSACGELGLIRILRDMVEKAEIQFGVKSRLPRAVGEQKIPMGKYERNEHGGKA
jgi:hypothetical protein